MANILIVDDEQPVRQLLKEILEVKGYKCIPAANVAEARECLKNQAFELALCDINLPGETGLELAQHIVPSYPKTAAIMVTATDDPLVAKEALEIGVYDYITKPIERNRVLISVANALRRRELEIENRKHNKHLEAMVNERTESLQNAVKNLEKTRAELQESEEKFRTISASAQEAIIMVDDEGKISFWNQAAEKMFGFSIQEALQKDLFTLIASQRDHEAFQQCFCGVQATDHVAAVGKLIDLTAQRKDKTEFPIELSLSKMTLKDKCHALGIIRDISARKILEAQLVQAQKLESIGQLAAGIAHEINTPTQWVSYNTRFLKEKFADLDPLLEKYQELFNAAKDNKVTETLLEEIKTMAQDIDLTFLREEIPPAIDQSLEGVERVSEIVRAMKEFSHPGTEEKTPIDINKAIESTITVARNEWKYVAEMKTDLDSNLPVVPCLPGDFNQVILNMVINAAHAIEAVVGDGSDQKGTIAVSTRCDDGWAEIRISDTGSGIADEHRSRIFDPFFTTKEVGRGTGQGLAISHSVIVKKHDGSLRFESETGKGTTFIIRLPLQAESG